MLLSTVNHYTCDFYRMELAFSSEAVSPVVFDILLSWRIGPSLLLMFDSYLCRKDEYTFEDAYIYTHEKAQNHRTMVYANRTSVYGMR